MDENQELAELVEEIETTIGALERLQTRVEFLGIEWKHISFLESLQILLIAFEMDIEEKKSAIENESSSVKASSTAPQNEQNGRTKLETTANGDEEGGQ